MIGAIERRQQILDLTNDRSRVEVDELAKRFDVSTVTIRGDLNFLAKKGLVVRSRGGALASGLVAKELSIDEKHGIEHASKVLLGKRAAQLIDSGDAIILDSGSTTLEIARNIASLKDLIVMTNGLNIASLLANNTAIELLVTGGTLRQKTLSFYGEHAEASLSNRRFDKLFIGVDGLDPRSGLTTHFELEARLNRKMIEASELVIAVADSTKFERRGSNVIASLDQVDVLITDSRISTESESIISDSGVDLIVVPYS